MKKDENEVEVTYTGKEIYRLTDDEGHYDGKISTRSDGGINIFETTTDWEDHSHKIYDKDGNKIYDRPEGYGHKWQNRIKDHVSEYLSTLSKDELNYIKLSIESYLKRNQGLFEEDILNKQHTKKLTRN